MRVKSFSHLRVFNRTDVSGANMAPFYVTSLMAASFQRSFLFPYLPCLCEFCRLDCTLQIIKALQCSTSSYTAQLSLINLFFIISIKIGTMELRYSGILCSSYRDSNRFADISMHLRMYMAVSATRTHVVGWDTLALHCAYFMLLTDRNGLLHKVDLRVLQLVRKIILQKFLLVLASFILRLLQKMKPSIPLEATKDCCDQINKFLLYSLSVQPRWNNGLTLCDMR